LSQRTNPGARIDAAMDLKPANIVTC
jgi:hypothetical protein